MTPLLALWLALYPRISGPGRHEQQGCFQCDQDADRDCDLRDIALLLTDES